MPPDYYTDLLFRLLSEVWRHHGSALPAPRLQFLIRLLSAPPSARRLWIRLALRTRPLTRIARTRWPEIVDVHHASAQLAARGLADVDPPDVPVAFYLDLFDVDELRRRFPAADRGGRGGRAALLARIVALDPGIVRARLAPERCVRAAGLGHLRWFERVYFGTGGRGLADLIAADTGCLRVHPLCAGTHADLGVHPRELSLLDRLRRARALLDRAEVLAWPALAQNVRAQLRRPLQIPWAERERRALLGAAEARRSRARTRRSGTPCGTRAVRTLEVPLQSLAPGVEAAVGATLARPGETWCHAENRFLRGVFGLLFWDVLYWPDPRLYRAPLQRGPGDLGTWAFVPRRAPVLTARLARLAAGHDPWPAILRAHDAWRHHANPWVPWRSLDEALLRAAAACMSPWALAVLAAPLLRTRDLRPRGLPDLLFLDPAGRRFRLIEVKGPGDRLQRHQRAWLRHLTDAGIDVAVARVVRARGRGRPGAAGTDRVLPP